MDNIMRRGLSIFLLLLLSISNLYSQEKIFPQPQIEFSPKSYVCYRTDRPILVDGILDENIWSQTEWTDYFADIEGNLKPLPRFKTRVKMLWDEKYFYIAAELEEPNLWATLKQRDTIIYYDNDFEVFIDPDGDTHNYYELEINALKTAWDSNGKQVAFNSWDITGLKIGVHLNGTINDPSDKDKGWTSEIALPWTVLRESFTNDNAPKSGEQWRINFSRVEWKLKNLNGKYEKEINTATNKPFPEDNWVWSPQGLIAMHYPEMWGFVQFSDNLAGNGKYIFKMTPDDYAKWALRIIYYNEKTFYMNNQKYTNEFSILNLQNINVAGYIWPPDIEATTNTFEARIKSINGKQVISIKDDGAVTVKISD
jgi:hypothetical protein